MYQVIGGVYLFGVYLRFIKEPSVVWAVGVELLSNILSQLVILQFPELIP